MDPNSTIGSDPPNEHLSELLAKIHQIKEEATTENEAFPESLRDTDPFVQPTIVPGIVADSSPIAEQPQMNEATINPAMVVTEAKPQPVADPAEAVAKDVFVPKEPQTFRDAKLTDAEVEALVMKFLLARGAASGREISDQIKLPYLMIEKVLRQLKNDQLIGYTGAAAAGDHICRLGDTGRERAKRMVEVSTYFGSAPVDLKEYVQSVSIQSIEKQRPTRKDLERAFSDLLLNQRMFSKLGPAINSGRGLFLFGFPGNGKTSIAERITRSFGRHIWIPRAISVDGEIIRLFDPVNHVEAPLPKNEGYISNLAIDQRWVRIERPTIVVGGELQMSHLEIQFNPNTGISEAPVQLKSNCGTLVIDDFGRQRMSVDELLNRWIVPLEMRYDFLNTLSGKKIQVPFDQLIVFSTNLEPRDLVDDAFLRRIPYKIEVENPSEVEFRQLFVIMCEKVGFKFESDAIDYLIEEHYKKKDRPFRNCHPRDLLQQVKNQCLYESLPMLISREAFDFAVDNYFSVV